MNISNNIYYNEQTLKLLISKIFNKIIIFEYNIRSFIKILENFKYE